MPTNMEPETYHRIVRNARNDKSARTLRNYRCQWRRWSLFCDQREHTPLPAKPLAIAEYLLALRDMGRKPTTMQAILAAIAWGHTRRHHNDPTRDQIVRKTLAAIKQERKEAGRPGPKQARGLTAERLAKIRASIYQPRTAPGGFTETEARARKRARRDIALMAVMRDALLRQSEAVNLRWADIALTGDGGALVRVKSSKTSDRAAHLYIRPGTAKALRAIMPDSPEPDSAGFRPPPVGDGIQHHRPGGDGGGTRGWVLRPLAARRHGPGPRGQWGEPCGDHAGGPVEVRRDGWALHRTPPGTARRGRQPSRTRMSGGRPLFCRIGGSGQERREDTTANLNHRNCDQYPNAHDPLLARDTGLGVLLLVFPLGFQRRETIRNVAHRRLG